MVIFTRVENRLALFYIKKAALFSGLFSWLFSAFPGFSLRNLAFLIFVLEIEINSIQYSVCFMRINKGRPTAHASSHAKHLCVLVPSCFVGAVVVARSTSAKGRKVY